MKRIRQTAIGLAIVSTSMFSSDVFAQPKKEEIVKAINETAKYVSEVILDKEGKSRCDYNVTEGKWYEYEVPWHTGQAVNSLVAAYKATNNKSYLDAAKRGGNFWISMEIKDNPKLKGMVDARHGDVLGDEFIVFATVSDGTPGIYELSKVTKDPRYAKVATNAADWMLKNMYYPEKGVCYDNIQVSTGEVLKEYSPFWKQKDQKDQELFDVSRPNTEGSLFKDAFEFSGDKKFKDAFILLCNSLLEKQGPDGVWMRFMPNSEANKTFHPRFSLWYAESLIEAFKLTGDRKYLEGAAKTARAFAKAQQKDGTIFYDNYTDGQRPDKGSATGSAVALAGIVWIELSKEGFKEFDTHIEKSATWILKNRYAVDHPDPNLRGAVLETRTRFQKGKVWFTNRDIGTSFALRFLVDYKNFKFK
ncbi:glycoside hydrolase family 88 protein [Terrimonas sp. NA20]|uniref:Glycoside hydrolase family 88 protein n=1 Tax=Terrimonas ginsenosidimutans TaxID=2908004 RepID=A0ABS9KU82_9BACT|nr:glycoside hydrolase family 88 protein [Terrimonas ginsenosidimutans]MCG2615866.1 glycoside hydrolase family 88 protein [Terrimonas ginsenosidimutans]